VLVPAQSLTGFESFSNLFLRLDRGERKLKCTRQERGTALVRQGEGLFLVQKELTSLTIVGDVAAGRLVAEPFPNVALGGT
jgi:hypothetical protein